MKVKKKLTFSIASFSFCVLYSVMSLLLYGRAGVLYIIEHCVRYAAVSLMQKYFASGNAAHV